MAEGLMEVLGWLGGALGVLLLAVLWFAPAAVTMWWLWARDQKQRQHVKTDVADVTMLFQTMRGIVHQQKQLARDFNAAMDRKMGLLREVLAKAVEESEALRDRQRRLEERLDRAEADLDSLLRQLDVAGDHWERQPPVGPPAPPHLREDISPADMPAEQRLRPAEPAEQPAREEPPAPSPKAKSALTELFDEWASLSLDPLKASAPREDVEEEQDAAESAPAHEDAEAARGAFRALLDLDSVEEDEDEELLGPPNGGGGAAEGASDFSPSLRRRVIEYSSAGMAVGDIAAELGIGRGEVRLLLSLSQQQAE